MDVVTVSSAQEGLALLEQDAAFDVVVCDLMMPMDGPHFYAEMQRIAPALTRRVVFCSNGAFTPQIRTFVSETDLPVLNKPVDRVALLTSIQSVL